MAMFSAAFDTLVREVYEQEVGQGVDDFGTIVSDIIVLAFISLGSVTWSRGSLYLPLHTTEESRLLDPSSQAGWEEDKGPRAAMRAFWQRRRCLAKSEGGCQGELILHTEILCKYLKDTSGCRWDGGTAQTDCLRRTAGKHMRWWSISQRASALRSVLSLIES